MTYITILNNDLVTCATDQLILSKNEIKELNTIDKLLSELTELKESEESKLHAVRQEAYQDGFNEGLNEGKKELSCQFREYLKDTTHNVYLNSMESEETIINLATEIIRKIASDFNSKDVITGIVSTAIKEHKHFNQLEIRVNPIYVEYLKDTVSNLNENGSRKVVSIDIIGDPEMGDLDCVIKTESGTTVASFDEQLNQLKNLLTENAKMIKQ
jgi:flagellar assembly protein FliH